MNKILCPIDFSPPAGKALEYASFIAQHAEAHLSILHVVHLPIVDTSETALMASELLEEQLRDAADKLKATCRHLEEKYGANQPESFTCDYVLKEALLTDAAKQMTKNEGYDLIVMGTSGLNSTVEEFLIGSNTEAVTEEVRCPVLSVPGNAAQPDIRKIIYASDYSPDDKEALEEVVKLGSLFGASIDVVHVVKELTAEGSVKAERFWSELRRSFPDVPMQFQEVVSRHRDEGLKDYFRQENGSILAILRKEKGFLQELFSQSLAERMTYQAQVPLLVLHGRKQ